MQAWEKIFKNEGKYFLKPIASMPKISGEFKRRKVAKILDLGCGSGRHLVYLAQKGYDMYAIDSSVTGIGIAKKWIKSRHLKAHFKRQDIYKKLPYASNSFDAIISTYVLHHNYEGKIKYLIKEMERVLKEKGLIFFTVPKFRHIRRNQSAKRLPLRKVGYMTYISQDGEEMGLPHFYFNKNTIEKYFNKFKILDFNSTKTHYEVLAQLK